MTEVDLFACRIALYLKPSGVEAFARAVGHDSTPLRRKQSGFQGKIAFVVPDGTETVRGSLWGY